MLLTATRIVRLDGFEPDASCYLGGAGLLAHVVVRLCLDRRRRMSLQLTWSVSEASVVTIRSGTMTLAVRDKLRETSQIRAGQFPSSLDGGWPAKTLFEPTDEITVTLVLDIDEEAPFRTSPMEAVKAEAVALTTHRGPEVRFHFPRVRKELSSSASILSGASPFFSDMLSSGFQESRVGQLPKRDKRGCIKMDPFAVIAEDDSDEETDVHLYDPADTLQRPVGPAADDNDDTSWKHSHHVVVSDFSYTTYHAVLTFLHTGSGHIEFAPLRSSFLYSSSSRPSPLARGPPDTGQGSKTEYPARPPPSQPPTPKVNLGGKSVTSSIATSDREDSRQRDERKKASLARLAFISSTLWDDGSLPALASPKSVYRLAHFLSLDQLRDRALERYKRMLTSENVIAELCDDAVAETSELKEAGLEFAVAHWSTVASSRGMKDLEALGYENQPRSALVMMVELARRLGDRRRHWYW